MLWDKIQSELEGQVIKPIQVGKILTGLKILKKNCLTISFGGF